MDEINNPNNSPATPPVVTPPVDTPATPPVVTPPATPPIKNTSVLGDDGEPGNEGDKSVSEFKPNIPEGTQVEETLLNTFTSWVNENKIQGETAQKMVDSMLQQQKAFTEQQNQEIEKIRTSMYDAVKKDPEIGKDMEATKSTCRKALQQYGDENLQKLLNERVGNLDVDPSLIRFLYRVGKDLSEERMNTDGRPQDQSSQQEINKAMYPNSPELWGK